MSTRPLGSPPLLRAGALTVDTAVLETPRAAEAEKAARIAGADHAAEPAPAYP